MNDIDKDKPAPAEGKTPEGEAQVAKSTAADKADGPAPRKSSIPESATATETPPEKPGRSGKLVWFLVLILLLGSGYIAWPVWSPALPEGLRATLAPVMEFGRSFTGEKEAALEKRLIRLERFVADYGAVSILRALQNRSGSQKRSERRKSGSPNSNRHSPITVRQRMSRGSPKRKSSIATSGNFRNRSWRRERSQPSSPGSKSSKDASEQQRLLRRRRPRARCPIQPNKPRP